MVSVTLPTCRACAPPLTCSRYRNLIALASATEVLLGRKCASTAATGILPLFTYSPDVGGVLQGSFSDPRGCVSSCVSTEGPWSEHGSVHTCTLGARGRGQPALSGVRGRGLGCPGEAFPHRGAEERGPRSQREPGTVSPGHVCTSGLGQGEPVTWRSVGEWEGRRRLNNER